MQIILDERPDEEGYQALLSRVEKIYPHANVYSVVDFIQTMIGGISAKLESLKVLILAIVLVINILVVVLMQKMFLIRERTQVGMLKLIGFSDASVISWQTKRIMMVLFVGILLGTITATPFSQLTSGQVFQMMGASQIVFEINPWEVYLVYPVALFVVTTLACMITMLKVRKTSAIAILQED
ncbi:MAG: ABC transporter permease [Lachnospiraceae bacterium]|nr:ABC transporter permease [Lachnospiraceae bacterium]